MERSTAKRIIRDEISTYKLQRVNDVYNSMGLGPIINTFNTCSTNIAMLPPNALSIGTAVALLGSAIYTHQLSTHPATKKIRKLRDLDYRITSTSLVDDMSEEELSDIAKTKLYK